MLAFLESCPEDELIILGTDEDVFLPSYIEKAEAFLLNNTDYSSHIGRYITLSRPFLGLNRISHFRDYITVNDISTEEPHRKLTTLMTMILVGCSPVFFSEKCEKCGGPVRIIASIEDSDVIQKILKHLGLDRTGDPQNRSPPSDLTDQPTSLF